MNYWIGIVGSSLVHRRLTDGIGGYFCLPETCEVGDLVGLYVTRRAYKNPGFFGVFCVEKKDPTKNAECKTYGTVTRKSDCTDYIELKQTHTAEKNIGIEILKTNSVLSTSSFVRKNMLGTHFQASKREFDELLKLVNLLPAV